MGTGISYLIKVPLALSLVGAASAIAVFILTYYLLASHLEAESLHRVQQLSRTLAASSRSAIAHEEIWDVYQYLSAPLEEDDGTEILVVTAEGRVMVASDPVKYPVGTTAAALPAVLSTLAESEANSSFRLAGRAGTMLGAAAPVVSDDGRRLASVLVYTPRDATLPQLHELLWRLLGYGLLALAVQIPIGWLLGRRLVKPLNDLRLAMAEVDQVRIGTAPEEHRARVDEIVQLTAQFEFMRSELERSRELENQMQVAERMAMAGKLASALAHEVNNPLGGMLNAISNIRRRGVTDPFVEKTANLIERGLRQIQESVSALMTHARREHTLLSAPDFDDLRTLSAPLAARHAIPVRWQVECGDGELAIRAVPVRQIVLNLVLNAIRAAHSTVVVEARVLDQQLQVRVYNDGPAFAASPDLVPGPDAGGRTGLGLWVCFRLARQLEGELLIQPARDGNGTEALLTAPLEENNA